MAATAQKTTPNGDGPNGWAEYRRLVLSELERISNAVAKCDSQSNAFHLTLSKAISDARDNLLDKLHKSCLEQDTERDRLLKEMETQYDQKFTALEVKTDKHTVDLTSLKTKSAVLGALAGFLVALGGFLATVFMKK